MAKKKPITRVLSCLVVIIILMMPVSVFAVNDSDNSSGDCAPIPDADMPVIYLNDTGATILTDVSNDTREAISALSCNVYVKIDDDTCVGYDVYVDGVYQFTEGQSGTPDGYCAFYVSAGTHKFELRKNGCSTSKNWYCQCGTVYRWVSMPDNWCEGGNHGEVRENEIKFTGTAIKYYESHSQFHYWVVRVDKIISGPQPCKDQLDVCIWDYEIPDPWGSVDQNLKEGDQVEVYGTYYEYDGICSASLYGSTDYYIKKIGDIVCEVYVIIDDDTCVGYEVYVDGVYQFTEGESGTPDGYCSFHVTPGTHKFELRNNGCSVSKSWYCQCGTDYSWVSMNDMDPHWCNCHQPKKEVKFRGMVTGLGPYVLGSKEWYVSVDEWISESLPCDEIDVIIGIYPPMGHWDENINKGDSVEVYGSVDPNEKCYINLNGESYYIKKIESCGKILDYAISDGSYPPGQKVIADMKYKSLLSTSADFKGVFKVRSPTGDIYTYNSKKERTSAGHEDWFGYNKGNHFTIQIPEDASSGWYEAKIELRNFYTDELCDETEWLEDQFKIEPSGSTRGSDDIRVTKDPAESVNPKIAVDSNNNIHTVWEDSRDGNHYDIYYTKLDNKGNTLVDDKRLTHDAAYSSQLAIATDLINNVHITWVDTADWIYYTKLDNDGNILVDNKKLTVLIGYDYDDAYVLGYPHIANDSSDNIHVVWDDGKNPESELYYMKLDDNGNKLVSDKRLTFDSELSWHQDIVVDTSDNIHIAWVDYRSGIKEVYYTKLDSSGNTLIDDKKLTKDSTEPWGLTADIDSNDNIHITWSDSRDGIHGIYYSKLDKKGNILVDAKKITSSGLVYYQSIAVDSKNDIDITWWDARDGNEEIYYTKLDNNGNTLIDDTRLTYDPAFSGFPDIAVDSNAKVHITWQDDRDGNWEIYYKTTAIADGNGFHFTITVTDSAENNLEGAKVYIDGEYKGETNSKGELKVKLTDGYHTVEAKKSGYKSGSWDGEFNHTSMNGVVVELIEEGQIDYKFDEYGVIQQAYDAEYALNMAFPPMGQIRKPYIDLIPYSEAAKGSTVDGVFIEVNNGEITQYSPQENAILSADKGTITWQDVPISDDYHAELFYEAEFVHPQEIAIEIIPSDTEIKAEVKNIADYPAYNLIVLYPEKPGGQEVPLWTDWHYRIVDLLAEGEKKTLVLSDGLPPETVKATLYDHLTHGLDDAGLDSTQHRNDWISEWIDEWLGRNNNPFVARSSVIYRIPQELYGQYFGSSFPPCLQCWPKQGMVRVGLVELYDLPAGTQQKTIYVDDDFVDDPPNHKWDTIQEGVDDAEDGDTVLVYSGTYNENVKVTKSLTIKSTSGDPKDRIVQAKNPDDPVFEVTADDVTISGFTVDGGLGSNGIYLNSVKNCEISNNNCSGHWAIALGDSSNNAIIGNNCSNNDVGISLWNSNNNALTGNNVTGNYIGIEIGSSSGNILTENTLLKNNWNGVYLQGTSSNNELYHNNFINNSASDMGTLNQWDNGYPSGGNYWSDYKEKYKDEYSKDPEDVKCGPNQDQLCGGDGIWDKPYKWISGNADAEDKYPMVDREPPELPDLTLSLEDISFSNLYPAEGESITINATIHNIGGTAANNVTLQFFDGDPDSGTQIGTNQIIYLITAGGNETVNVTWVAEIGIHDIYVAIDRYGNITESNESNNKAYRSILIGECTKDIIAQKILLKQLNYGWNYDFYEEYHNYDDNATGPDPVKDPDGCTIPLDDSDIWIVHFSLTSPGFYPSLAAIMGPVIGVDTNTWYNWSTPVKNVYGKQEITYPELKVRSVEKWVSMVPWIGEDLEELLGGLLNASEFSIKLDGVYAQAPMRWDNRTNQSSIPIKFSGKAIGPTGIGEGGNCEMNFEKFYDMDDPAFFGDTLNNIACRANIGLPNKSIGYTKSVNGSLEFIEFDGTGMLDLLLSPSGDAGVRIRVDDPIAVAQAGMCELNAELSARAVGDISTRVPLPLDFLNGNWNVNCSLPTPTLENPVTFIGETVLAIQNFSGDEYIESVYTNFSGYYYRFEDLHQLIPEFIITIYPIVINYSLCFNLTEINPDIPCGHIDIPPFGPIDIYPCELCLFNGTLLSIDEWWYHVSLYDLIFDSPVDVHIYDSMGRHIGQNATNGIALEIPYSTYIVNGSKKRLTFPTTTDKFMLVLNGTDAGTYNMTVYRSILISGVNNTNIIKGITYRVDNMPTNTGTIDYYNINFDEIEKQVNEKVHTGMNITDAINESFDLIISDKNVTKFPTALFASDAFGADGDQVVLHARLMSLDNSLGNKAITFKIDDNVVGQTITDVYGNVTLNYTILNDMDIGIHQISTIYSGDSSYTNTEGYASLNVLNKPPEVQLDLPSPIVRGTSLINGTIIDAKLEQIMLKIDNVIVADSIPYLWESTKYADGLHLIQLTAIDSFGEKGQSNAFVIVDNTVPTITITSPVNGTTYPTISVNLNYTISEPTVWVGYSLDGAENVTLYGNTILTGLGEGIHTVTVYANDTPGNMGSASIYFITLSGGKTIYVDDDFADDPPNHKWDTIQEGIIDANEGDTINVRDGTYTENIDVTKSHLTIKSENGFANCFVQAANPNDHIFEITADNVNINGFTLKNATGSWKAGIYLASDHNTISNNSALNNYNGIYLSSSNNNQLTDNIANTNNNCGILLRNESNSNILTNNTANFNTNFGIFLYPASHNILTNNTANSNEWNGMHLDYSNNNLLISNIANSNRKDGISVNYPSSNNTLINNTANTNNRDGFHLWSSSSNKLMSNIANSNHKYGISLSSTANNNISCNWVVQNQQGGFHITDGCTGNIIKDNNIMANGGIAGDSWHYNFYNDQSDDVIVENNYWGTDSIAIIAESIYDKSDDPSKGMVDFEPSLTEPAPCAPGSGPKLCTSPDPPSHDFGTVPKNKEPSWSFELWNCESDTLTWTVNVDQPGITVYPTSGSTTTEIDTVTVTLGGVYYLGLSPGTYTGHITVKSNGGSKIGTITVKVPNPYPIASFTYIPPGPDVNKGVIFDASLSNDPGGFITNYEWNFGDGSYGTGKVVTHSYSSAGTYKVTLRVTDNDGTVNSTSKSVSVAGGLQQFTFLSTDNAVPITIDGTLQSSPYTASWTSGSVHSVNALSEFIAQPDCLKYVFTGWTGAITLSYTLLPPTFSPGTYTANYKKQYYLTVDTEPQGIATISGAGWYDEGAMATTGNAPKEVTVGDENYLFETWKVDGSPVSLPFDWIPLKMDNCHTVTASYQQIDGLVAEWHFDEGSGSTVKDNTGNGNDGIIHGATWINGIKGKALKFDGKDDYVEVQDSSSLRITGNIKVEAWVKVEELGSKYHFIVSKHYTPAGYTLFINPANKFAFEINGQPVASTTTPELGKWYHVVGTYDQSQLKIYVNDVLENTKSCTAKLATNNQKLRIGQWSAGGYCFKGIIDEVNIYANA